jgi:cupin 2 domain-containing protein
LVQIHTLSPKGELSENSETVSTLFQNGTIKIESIQSWLRTPGEFYDQDQDEWVILLEGEAQLEIENLPLNLKSGDYCFLPRHCAHRVLSTSKNALWLAVFSS